MKKSIKHILSICMAGCCGLYPEAALADSDFEEAFLRGGKNGASKDVFIYQDAITPGLKLVDIAVNGTLAERVEINFINNNNQIIPCLSMAQLKQLGIKVQLYDGWASVKAALPQTVCENIPERIPAATMIYDDTQQLLKLTVPQEAIDRQRFSMIDPREWDHGVPSLRTSYNGYVYSSRLKGRSGDGWRTDATTMRSSYASFNTIGSFGPWRLYSTDSLYHSSGRGLETNHDRLYLSRDIAALRSRLQAGDIYSLTSAYMLGALPLRGVSLATNERMWLDNQFAYAPVIRGVARTNARLIVRQNNHIIYSTMLTPGSFAIDDMNSAQVGADLAVTIEESDGQIQFFRVPYTALPNMIRPGAIRYNVAAGEYRTQGGGGDKPVLATGDIEYGFEAFTLSGMWLMAKDYQAASAEIAWNIGNIGAFSTEVAHTRHQDSWTGGNTRDGSAVRFLYARNFEITGTSLQILGYQYRSKEFLDFQEFLALQERTFIGDDWQEQFESQYRRRNRIEANISQNLNDYGNLYLNVSQDRYYGTRQKSTSVTGGAGTLIGNASVSLSFTSSKNRYMRDNQLSLSVSLPLGSNNNSSQSFGSLSYGLNRDRDNRYNQSLGYSGNALDNTVNYYASLQRNTRGEFSQSGSLGYNGSKAALSGGMSRGSDYRQYSASMSGGVVLYSGGVVLAPHMGDTIAIVETQGASGIGVGSQARTDYFGHAVVSWLTPYRYNTINLDTTNSEDVELKTSMRKVVPSEGAAVLLKFATRVGRRALVEIRGNRQPPLGAMVYLQGEREEAGIVGDKGMIYLSGLDARTEQKLRVVWGESPADQCSFSIPALTKPQSKQQEWYKKIVVNCS